MTAQAVTADSCPTCGAEHGRFDTFWACPRHGHRLIYDGPHPVLPFDRWRCPGFRCHYERTAPRAGKGHAVTITEPSSATLAVREGQDFWDAKQLAALAQLGIKDASNADLAVYLHYCQKTGLDPFSRQIYMLSRRVKDGDSYETRQAIQIGIDGYRIIASRAARRDGVTISYGQTLWYDGDGRAWPVWTRPEPPAACTVIVRRGADDFPGIARFASFAQYKDRDRTILSGQWAIMGDHLIAKCAEAQALRRAFPHDLAGTSTMEEGGAVDGSSWVTPQPAIEVPARPKRQRRQPAGDGAGLGLREQISSEFGRLGIEDDTERTDIIALLTGTDDGPIPDDPALLGPALQVLKQCADVGEMYEAVKALPDG
jgi:phage recombination protein Bet